MRRTGNDVLVAVPLGVFLFLRCLAGIRLATSVFSRLDFQPLKK